MAARKSTNISLMVLGLVSFGVIGYFVWLFLSPPPPLAVVTPVLSTDIETGLVESSDFQVLQPYVNLPIRATNVGRINPFEPFNVNIAPSGVTGETNTPKAPLINEQEPTPPPLNTNTP